MWSSGLESTEGLRTFGYKSLLEKGLQTFVTGIRGRVEELTRRGVLVL